MTKISDKHNLDIESSIKEYMEKCNDAKTSTEVSNDFDITKYEAKTILEKMSNAENSIIEKYKTEVNTYYIYKSGITAGELDTMKTNLIKYSVTAKEELEKLYIKSNTIEQHINSMYVNIFSGVSIFVAILSLILFNANITYQISLNNMTDALKSIVIINISVVVCIVLLLLAVRIIILNMFKNKKNMVK